GRGCADQSPASAGDLLVQQFPNLADCPGCACRSGCDLAGSLVGEFPPLASNVELRKHIEIRYQLLSAGTLHFVTACVDTRPSCPWCHQCRYWALWMLSGPILSRQQS